MFPCYGWCVQQQGIHRAHCSWNKMPQVEEQKCSPELCLGGQLCWKVHLGGPLSTPLGTRHSNMVQVVQIPPSNEQQSLGIPRSILTILGLDLKISWTFSYWTFSYILPPPTPRPTPTTNTVPWSALIAPLPVAFIFQNLCNYIFEGIIHFFFPWKVHPTP